MISCNGSVSGIGRRYCPTRTLSAECQISMSSLSPSVNSESVSCSLSEYNESMTICICNLPNAAFAGQTGSVSFSIVSVQKSVLDEFVSTWKSASTLSSSAVVDGWVVFVTIGCLAGSFIFLLVWGVQQDVSDKKHSSLSAANQDQLSTRVTHFSRESFSRFISSSRNLPKKSPLRFVGQLPTVRETKRRVLIYESVKLMEESLPTIFKSDSLWNKFKHEMKVYHRWLGIVFYYSPEFPRSLRVLSLFSSIVIMLFIQSVTYDIADPDDGSCEKCHTTSCCLSLKSSLNQNEDRCNWRYVGTGDWNVTSDPGGMCSFREIGEDATRMFIITVLSAIISAPFALTVQYVIGCILSKESLTRSDLEKIKNSSLGSSNRRTAVAAEGADLVESCGSSGHEDLRNLLSDWGRHHRSLLSENAERAEEFQGTFLECSLFLLLLTVS